MVWISRIYTPQALSVTSEFIKLEYTLNHSWLASLVGSVEIRIGNSTAIVMINPNDIFDFTAIKRPSRDKHDKSELIEEEKRTVIESFKASLRQGRTFVNVPSTLSTFKAGIVYLTKDDTEYVISMAASVTLPEKGNKLVNWNDAVKLDIILPVHAGSPPVGSGNYLYNALTKTGEGILHNAIKSFDQYLNELPIQVLQRSMIYLGYQTEIDLYHIGRDGKGTNYKVMIEDTGVNDLLAAIASFFPAALVKYKSKYLVKNGPLMWIIIRFISDRIRSITPIVSNVWPNPNPEKRPLWEHQIDSINNLIETRHSKKARIMWLDVGMGKTAIVTNYISRLINIGTMNRYCVYTLPPSALSTVQREFDLLNIPSAHVDMRVTSKTQKEILPGRVNFIYHDHLRLMNLDEIKSIAPHMIFIVDEFHKTLNATLRTSTALEIAHLADDVIAMTGTLIKDTDIDQIIAWLSMAVNFEVTTNNYWIALSSIISRKVQTRVVVERIVIESPFNEDERARYYKVVPSNLGGTSNKIDFRAALEISYEAVTRQLITLTVFHITNRLGVFLVARNIAHQQYLYQQLQLSGIKHVFLIGKDNPVNLTPTEPPPNVPVPDVVITTPSYSEGYNLTRYRVMIMAVFLGNHSTYTQLEGRINRISQTAPTVRVITVHAGILSYIFRHYENTRRIADAIKGFAKEAQLDPKDVDY